MKGEDCLVRVGVSTLCELPLCFSGSVNIEMLAVLIYNCAHNRSCSILTFTCEAGVTCLVIG